MSQARLLDTVPLLPHVSARYLSEPTREHALRTIHNITDAYREYNDKKADAQLGVALDMLDSTIPCAHERLKLTDDPKRPVECRDCGREWMVVG